jgi:hypothetical protein
MSAKLAFDWLPKVVMADSSNFKGLSWRDRRTNFFSLAKTKSFSSLKIVLIFSVNVVKLIASRLLTCYLC